MDSPEWPLLLKFLEPVRESAERALHNYKITEKEHAFSCGRYAALEVIDELTASRIREMRQELIVALKHERRVREHEDEIEREKKSSGVT